MDSFLIFIFFIITLMYMLSGKDKILNFRSDSDGLNEKVGFLGKSSSDFLMACAILIEIIAPVVLLLFASGVIENKTYSTLASVALTVFTITATLIYHFPPTGSQYYPFMSNLTSVGALLLVTYVIQKN